MASCQAAGINGEDVLKELQSKKWGDNMVEVHATTLDSRVSDTLGCFLKGKGDRVSISFSFVFVSHCHVIMSLHSVTDWSPLSFTDVN